MDETAREERTSGNATHTHTHRQALAFNEARAEALPDGARRERGEFEGESIKCLCENVHDPQACNTLQPSFNCSACTHRLSKRTGALKCVICMHLPLKMSPRCVLASAELRASARTMRMLQARLWHAIQHQTAVRAQNFLAMHARALGRNICASAMQYDSADLLKAHCNKVFTFNTGTGRTSSVTPRTWWTQTVVHRKNPEPERERRRREKKGQHASTATTLAQTTLVNRQREAFM